MKEVKNPTTGETYYIVHATVIKKAKNKSLAGREFIFDTMVTKEESETRIKAYFIKEGLFGELHEDIKKYFTNIYEGKVNPDNEDLNNFFYLFNSRYRLVI